MIAASMYKVALNMLITEMLETGEYDWDAHLSHVSYEMIRNETIINSSNKWAEFLWEMIIPYSGYRKRILPYLGSSEEEMPGEYYFDNRFTPKQIISCLKTLYEGGEERFPHIIETMQQAEPNRFFRYSEKRFDIAQKYGYISDGGETFFNSCAICYTDEPIAIVLFTLNSPHPQELLSAYCTAMCEYTQVEAEKRQSRADELLYAELEERSAEIISLLPSAALKESARVDCKISRETGLLICCITLSAGLIAVVILILMKRKGKFKALGLTIAAIAVLEVAILVLVGFKSEVLYIKPDSDPAETVTALFDELAKGEPGQALPYIENSGDISFGEKPQSGNALRLAEALEDSYRYRLSGQCEADKLKARQKVKFTYLDPQEFLAVVNELTMAEITQQSLTLLKSNGRVYDDDYQYVPELADEAYGLAFEAALQRAEEFYTTVELAVDMVYHDGRWCALASPEMIKALNGGL